MNYEVLQTVLGSVTARLNAESRETLHKKIQRRLEAVSDCYGYQPGVMGATVRFAKQRKVHSDMLEEKYSENTPSNQLHQMIKKAKILSPEIFPDNSPSLSRG